MKRSSLFLLLLSFPCTSLLVACGGPSVAVSAPEPTPAADSAAADWCVEHGLPESKCTVCSPALVPAFKAASDWCAGHGFPESVCPQCNPQEPPAGMAAPAVPGPDEPPADGTPVTLADARVAGRAGLSYATAESGGSSAEISAPATIVFDAARHAQVTPRAPGIVRAVHVDVGTPVRAGTPLALIESAAVGADRSRVAAARSQLEIAEREVRRHEDLHAQGIVATRDLDLARQARDAAEAELRALEAATAVAGDAGRGGIYVVGAPIAGVVVRRSASLGAAVDEDDVLFEVADTAVVWAEVELPEEEAAANHAGQPVTIELDALPGRAVTGVLHWIAPLVDPHTRTTLARVRLANPDGALRAGMYGRARLQRVATGTAAILVPDAAIQRVGGQPLVFVARDTRSFIVRRVTLGAPAAGRASVVAGLAAGERVVVDGAYLLKTETMKGSIGAGCCE